MMKVYDQVKCAYLREIMLNLSFIESLVNIIMWMVNSVSSLVLFNGEKLKEFKPSRGIHQGDPISAYNFLLAAEGFPRLLKSSVQSSNLT